MSCCGYAMVKQVGGFSRIVCNLTFSLSVSLSILDNATGSNFAIQGILFLPLKNPGIPEDGVRDACSSGGQRHTKHRDRPVHHRAVVDSFV